MGEKGAKVVLVRDAGSQWDSALEPFSSSWHASIQFTQSVAGMNGRFVQFRFHKVSSVMTTVGFWVKLWSWKEVKKDGNLSTVS